MHGLYLSSDLNTVTLSEFFSITLYMFVQQRISSVMFLILCILCAQVDKSSEGAGPLRTVKSEGQADERAPAVVNSVSQHLINKQQYQKQLMSHLTYLYVTCMCIIYLQIHCQNNNGFINVTKLNINRGCS